MLTDEQAGWRPDHFELGRWGGSTRLNFLPLKLLDYQSREASLKRDRSPFAQVAKGRLPESEEPATEFNHGMDALRSTVPRRRRTPGAPRPEEAIRMKCLVIITPFPADDEVACPRRL